MLGELVKAGIDANRLQATGLGAENPLKPNDSDDNEAQNRRVEPVKLS